MLASQEGLCCMDFVVAQHTDSYTSEWFMELIRVFWLVRPCRQVKGNRRFVGSCCFYLEVEMYNH
jgi:hypothetical protein